MLKVPFLLSSGLINGSMRFEGFEVKALRCWAGLSLCTFYCLLSGMSRIQIYARIRPGPQRCEGFQASTSSISLKTGFERDALFSKSPGAKHEFTFDHVFDEGSSQEDVFQKVALPVVDQFLLGYNGTVFAYGQTSSGKTYTMEGSARKYAERGIIPRVLSYMYEQLEKKTGEEWTVHISYMEIYQDVGFDLLNPGSRPGSLMVTLPKVSVGEGSSGEVIVRSLSSHLAANEEVALSLLFQGSTCRKVAETSMNQCSSRSHSIFSITLTTKAVGSEVITRSKMNLVDLAGSERVAKTGADGRVLQEAKHINLSLHHLEHVIVSLQQLARRGTPQSRLSSTPSDDKILSPLHDQRLGTSGSRRSERALSRRSSAETKTNHIPYRNCLLTLVLKDSLGGNCLTAMVATISVEGANVWETVSTCRFSQRVAAISNKARRNEELDDKALIKKLKQRIAQLEEEVLALKQEKQFGPGSILPSKPLDDADRRNCHQLLHRYLHQQTEDLVEEGINTLPLVQECFKVLRDIVIHSLPGLESSTQQPPTTKEGKGKGGTRESVAALSKKQRKGHKGKGSPGNGVGVTGKTPSPNSRQSSGFGSLQDEEGGLCDSFSNGLTKPVQPEMHCALSGMQTAPAGALPQAKSALPREKSLVVTQSHHFTSSPQHIGQPSVTSSITRMESLNSQKVGVSTSGQPHPSGTNMSVDNAQMMKEVPVSTSTREADAADSPQSLSKFNKPRHGVKQHQELQEQQELIEEVQLLALRVEEEKLQAQLSQIAELLARQHAHVLQLESSDAVSSEELCSERIAEQQLKIKQAKLHQKLRDAQHQMKMHGIVSEDGRKGRPSAHEAGTTKIVHSPPPVGHKLNSEQARRDTQQSKAQAQIDKLKVLQMEKELELREAATRRKLLAMKQQLTHGAAPNQGNSPFSPYTSFDVQSPHSTLTPSGTHTASNSHNPPAVYIPSHIATLSPDAHHLPNPPLSLGPSPSHPVTYKTPLAAAPVQTLDQARLSVAKNGKLAGTVSADTTVNSHTSTKPMVSITEQHQSTKAPSGTQRVSTTSTEGKKVWAGEHKVKTTPPEGQKVQVRGEDKVKTTPPEGQKAQVGGEDKVKTTPPEGQKAQVGKEKTKVSLPEEYKETAYMSALDRQKARVARVRRCIAAATIIQRWWRTHCTVKR